MSTGIGALSGASGYVAWFNSPSSITSDPNLSWSATGASLQQNSPTGQILNKGLLNQDGDVQFQGPVPYVDVRAFGATGGNAFYDNSPAIQAALNSLVGRGGIVYLPPGGMSGSYGITQTININDSSIRIMGGGKFGNFDIGGVGNERGTFVEWTGASGLPMFRFAPTGIPTGYIQASGVYTGTPSGSSPSGQALKGVALTDMTLEAAGKAAIGLQVISAQFSNFERLHIKNAYEAALDVNVARPLGEARDVTKTAFRDISIRQLDGPGGSGIGVRLNGDDVGNASLSTFDNIAILHLNGVAFKLLNADSNTIRHLMINRAAGGSGVGIELNGSPTSTFQARANAFFNISAGVGGMVSRGSGLAFPARDNFVFVYSQENGEPVPVQEVPPVLFFTTTTGVNATFRGNLPSVRLTQDFTTTVTGMTGIWGGTGTALNFPIIDQQAWAFDVNLSVLGMGTGMQIGLFGPSGVTIEATLQGIGTSVGTGFDTMVGDRLSSVGSAVSRAFATSSGVAGPIWIRGTAAGGGGGVMGVVEIRAASAVNGATSTVRSGSWMLVDKLN